eukprot:CAMPEP_0118705220 /NCGR_PEP_ID=MMETSP0800-20121206/19742_1 /TAXON_ID=210618 ORGANISM="Striatella unipunctata, Strain CCMP2910" /NCGR_SAMPLE_ID=MMETSP0800 /ASSEMBLY_ACC=CAM_ASM_000638 /LENGTH=405 /DNA_ID=CAMNT_0006607341 /DNA_START=751 /DNA_END=1966 /DNA_ORIENTATION=+
MLSRVLSVSGAVVTAGSLTAFPNSANARIGKDSEWPLWIALPVAPYSKRKTIRRNIGPGVWTFDQLIGIYYVHVPVAPTKECLSLLQELTGLLVYAPVAPTKECLSLLQELIDKYGPIKTIILPSVAVEHKVNAGPFARAFPRADFYATDRQYSFPLNLPSLFLGLPPWTKPLPASSRIDGKSIWGENSEFEHEVLTVKPGPGSQFQDVALFHKPSKTLLICDTVFATGIDPPVILTEEPDYTRALLFHARDEKDEVVPDTLENRRKGWRRIVLLFNFFFPGSGVGNLGPGPILQALGTPTTSMDGVDGNRSTNYLSDGGKPTVLPIIQIILARGPKEVKNWLNVVTQWNFERVIPAHLDAPLAIDSTQFAQPFQFIATGRNEVRFCDEDVAFLRRAEEGFLSFS